MNTCKSCKYWSIRRNILNNISDCDRPDCKPDKNITFEIEADAADDTNLSAILLTSGNFGCLLHEPKKPNNEAR
jgi:hypothetical protein